MDIRTLKLLVPKYYKFILFKRCCCNSDSFFTFFFWECAKHRFELLLFFFPHLYYIIWVYGKPKPVYFEMICFPAVQISVKVYSCLQQLMISWFSSCFQMLTFWVDSQDSLRRLGFTPSTSDNSICCYS